MRRAARFAVPGLAVIAVVCTMAFARGLRPGDTVGGFSFLVELGQDEPARVAVVEGIESATDLIEFRAGDEPRIRKLPGRHHVANVVLRRGVVREGSEWWEWRQSMIDGQGDRRNVRVSVIGPEAEVVIRVNLVEAWPVAYRLSPLDAGDSDPLVEELELAAEAIAVEFP